MVRAGVLGVVLVLLASRPAAGAQAGGAAALLDAALVRVREAAPGLALDHAEIARVVGEYATVRVYPQPGLTDPALVILRRQDGAWTVVAGPGTAFPDVEGLPPGLLGGDNPYTGENARAVLGEVGIPPKRYARPEFGFQYPEAAEIGLVRADVPTVVVGGPELTGPPFSGRAYEISVAALGVTPALPLDQWGYERMLGEIAEREAMNGVGGPNTQPLGAAYFHTQTGDVFQIDWFAGDSTIRDLYVATVGGGPVVQLRTRVYPVENNPAAPEAQAAVTRVLQTLRAGPAAGGPAPEERPEAFARFAGAWARNGLGLTIDEQGNGRLGWRVYEDAAVVRQGAATIRFDPTGEDPAIGTIQETSDGGPLTPSVPVLVTLLGDGLLLLTQGNAAYLLCGSGFLVAPETLRAALPCGYWP